MTEWQGYLFTCPVIDLKPHFCLWLHAVIILVVLSNELAD